MMRMRQFIAVGFVLAIAGSSLGAQVPAGLDSATLSAIAPVIERARAARLPLELLYTRARLGQVQRLPTAKIESAVRHYAERLDSARLALAPNPTIHELKAGVDALQSGVGSETLRKRNVTRRTARCPHVARRARRISGESIGSDRGLPTARGELGTFHRPRGTSTRGCIGGSASG
jgi:hypothetical protein